MMNNQKENTQLGLISIIVPVYKVENYLNECIESILAQTFKNFELILIDDGSPDNCGAICDMYAQRDSRIRVIHQENQGQAGARNTGLDIAVGEYITFIDSDDIVSNVYLEMLLDAMQNDTDITVCKYFNFENDTELLPLSEIGSASYTNYDSESIAIAIFNGNISAGPCGKLYRSKVIGHIRFPVGRIHEDVVFTPIVCYAAKKAVLLDKELYYYRVHENSTTHKKFTVKRYDAIWAIDYCIQFFEVEGKPTIVNAAKKQRKYTMVTYSIIAWRDKVTVPKEYKVNLLRAVLYLRKYVSDSYFEYYLAQIHPKLAVAHEYWRKIKSILHLPQKI